ncbi:MAG TPA: hypothetical protein VKV80_03925 [Streptosporangiaceae bacterium]|nr:hypothetical protein [Streptosporangiaceae bacterium]
MRVRDGRRAARLHGGRYAACRVLAAAAALGGACVLAAGCSAVQQPAPQASQGRHGQPAGAGRSGPSPSRTALGVSASPGAPGAHGTAGAPGSGGRARCAAWPAGSSATMLSITDNGSGKTYCVRTGEIVRVVLRGAVPPSAGQQPVALTGGALAPARPAQITTGNLIEPYRAVRPGRAVLTAVTLPCHAVPMGGTPAPRSAGAPGAQGTALPHAAGMALVTGSAPGGPAGGTPVGPRCATAAVFRVVIVVR